MTTRIALVLETSGGGSGRHVVDLARGLCEREFDVTVIYSPIRAIASFVAALEAIDGLQLVPLDMFRSVGFKDVRSLLALGALLRRIGPFDITHAHSSKAGALVRLLPASLTGKCLYTPHCFITMDPDLGFGKRFIYSLIERVLACKGDLLVVVSQREFEHARSLGIPEARISTVLNGADLGSQLEREVARREMDLGYGEIAFGFIGRLDSQKNPRKFVDAINKAHARVSSIRGVVFGDGPLRAELQTLTNSGTCRFMGWCDATKYSLGLDAFVITSRYEAMPYTLIEALGSGLAIIATNVGGVDETVTSDVNGMVVNQELTSAELAERLVYAACNSKELDRWGQASLSLSPQFSADRMVDRTEALYRRLLVLPGT